MGGPPLNNPDPAELKLCSLWNQRAPAVTRERMYLETLQQVYGNASKVYVDQKSGSNLLFLPLDKLMQSTQAGSTAESSAPPPAASVEPPPVPPSVDPRSRDSFRSRDREMRP